MGPHRRQNLLTRSLFLQCPSRRTPTSSPLGSLGSHQCPCNPQQRASRGRCSPHQWSRRMSWDRRHRSPPPQPATANFLPSAPLVFLGYFFVPPPLSQIRQQSSPRGLVYSRKLRPRWGLSHPSPRPVPCPFLRTLSVSSRLCYHLRVGQTICPFPSPWR